MQTFWSFRVSMYLLPHDEHVDATSVESEIQDLTMRLYAVFKEFLAPVIPSKEARFNLAVND